MRAAYMEKPPVKNYTVRQHEEGAVSVSIAVKKKESIGRRKMSNLVCPVCGSSNIQTERRPDGFHHCMECRYSWAIGASQQKQTVFDKITESVETLAKEFVAEFSIYGGRSYWCSLLLAEIGHSVFEQRFNTKEEAIAATVAELQKEWKG